ncbi:Lrp/AsnC family transcriptional regulator [Croceivirga thetidis]|uniref:Lrp/AsnC family transcriptional regulator n=1 Tax=Croceivirga thetidis TaxID=2721623 RepID=A0ABX1GRA7_9FLAO|nr:Lrp/AsnC family transcriptional regulator [Croceivirga thetidis]NKI32482.1 Lrp/AsnC family transcriptional regulator [Croceivirga thetidis]
MDLDEIDKKLLNLLQKDCKKTTKAYALELDLSTTATYERIRKLEREGVVEGYVAILDKSKIKKDFTVFCNVRLIQHTKDNIKRFEKQIQELVEVTECHHISGDYDYILVINVENMKAYREFMVSKLTAIDQIGSTQSSFSIDAVKQTTQILL